MEIEEQDRIQEAQFSKHRQQQQAAQNPPNHRRHDHASSSSSSSSSSSALEDQVKLAAISISFNARLKAADMPVSMQEHALRVARSVSDSAPGRTPNSSLLARVLKKEFDSEYGPAWHCVVGKSFGSFVTHSPGGFLYFSLDDSLVSVLLFKTEVRVVAQEP